MKSVLGIPAIKKHFAGLTANPTPAGPHQAKAPLTEKQLALEILPFLPHFVQARVLTGAAMVWSTLADGGLTTSTGDLLLKHGALIAGKWNMVGVLDAVPDAMASPAPVQEFEGYMKAIQVLGDIARPLLGRPKDAYGMTPLLIFREVSGG